MNKTFLLFIFLGLSFFSQAQKVSNIRAEQRGQDIVVFYTLETNSPCEVSLLLSQDNGLTWSKPLRYVSGDVGLINVSGDKQILWKVLEDREKLAGDKIKFKVITDSKKIFEPEMIFVEGGTFLMGSDNGLEDEAPIHSVTVGSFYIQKYEISQTQWSALMDRNPSEYSDCYNCPVEQVSWSEVQEYIKRLNIRTGKKYRLPTEAEWEFAAKGGKSSKGYIYSGSNNLDEVAWYYDNGEAKTHFVGTLKPNELGIYDMTGNVWEWCSDFYGSYSPNSETNPQGQTTGEYHVIRGGNWNFSPDYCRVTVRGANESSYSDYGLGFRLVLPLENGITESSELKQPENNRSIVTNVDAFPEYVGGEQAMFIFLFQNLEYPEDAKVNNIEGKVTVRFIVDVDGTASNFVVFQGVPGGASLDKAALEVCKKLGRFKPAMKNGIPVKTYMNIPISFNLGE